MRGIFVFVILAGCASSQKDADANYYSEDTIANMSETQRRSHASDRVAKLQRLLPGVKKLQSSADVTQRFCVQENLVMMKTIVTAAEDRRRELNEHIHVGARRLQMRSSRTLEMLYERGRETRTDAESCFDQPVDVYVEKDH